MDYVFVLTCIPAAADRICQYFIAKNVDHWRKRFSDDDLQVDYEVQDYSAGVTFLVVHTSNTHQPTQNTMLRTFLNKIADGIAHVQERFNVDVELMYRYNGSRIEALYRGAHLVNTQTFPIQQKD